LLAKPADYVGKTVQVKGKITEVCQMMGCWIYVADAQGNKIRVKVNDGEIVFPKDGAAGPSPPRAFSPKRPQPRAGHRPRPRGSKDSGRKFDPAPSRLEP